MGEIKDISKEQEEKDDFLNEIISDEESKK